MNFRHLEQFAGNFGRHLRFAELLLLSKICFDQIGFPDSKTRIIIVMSHNYTHFEQFGSHFGRHIRFAAYLIIKYIRFVLVKLDSLTPKQRYRY